MKYQILITFACLITLTNCSINNDTIDEPIKTYKTLWNLVNVTGGIAGVNEDFNTGDIIWSFDNETNTLTVTNTNTDNMIEDGFDSGTYSFSVTNNSENYFLIIENNEFGAYSITENQLIIDQNITTSGSGADGFIYTFQANFEAID
jgi:hypothetical protein